MARVHRVARGMDAHDCTNRPCRFPLLGVVNAARESSAHHPTNSPSCRRRVGGGRKRGLSDRLCLRTRASRWNLVSTNMAALGVPRCSSGHRRRARRLGSRGVLAHAARCLTLRWSGTFTGMTPGPPNIPGHRPPCRPSAMPASAPRTKRSVAQNRRLPVLTPLAQQRAVARSTRFRPAVSSRAATSGL